MAVLLKKKMVDKDLLFNLIGLGFEIDYKTLTVILADHRASHNTPYLYNSSNTYGPNIKNGNLVFHSSSTHSTFYSKLSDVFTLFILVIIPLHGFMLFLILL